MDKTLEKNAAVLVLLDRLTLRLGPSAFVLRDHWEADQLAVGIASPHNSAVLVYIS